MTKKMKCPVSPLLLVAALLGMSTFASADTHFGLVYAPTYTLLSSNTGGFGAAGGGLMLDLGLGQATSLEIDALYQTKVISTLSPTYADVGVALKFHLSPHFALSAGGYFDYLLSANSAILTNTDYGLKAGAMIDIPAGSSFGFVVGANFKYALANVSPGGTINLNQVQGLVGIRFGGSHK